MKLYIHTVSEPSAKKHLPLFSCFVKISMLCKKDPFFCDKADEAVFPEAYFVP
jgi:hypothetical protein